MDTRLVRLIESTLTAPPDLRLGQVLQDVVDAARDVIAVRYAALGVIGDDRFLHRFVHSGIDEDTVARIGHLPRGEGLLGWQTEHRAPLRLSELQQHPASEGFPAGHPEMTTFLSVPVHVGDQHFGNLYMCDRRDGRAFTADDEGLAVVLGALAGAAISNVRMLTELRRLSLIEDRERIGRELHDTVIQRLFATGLTLQGLARRIESDDPASAARLAGAVGDLDETIRSIRSAIFSLSVDDPAAPPSVRIRRLVGDELARVLGFTPRLELDGRIDEVLPARLVDDVLAVLREALTNVARHAEASAATVELEVADAWLQVSVRDDGVGLPADHRSRGGLGLRNLVARAAGLSGEMELRSRDDGTELLWRVPVTESAAS